MPRGKVPSLLSIGNGSISLSTASRSGQCSRCKTHIAATTKIALMKTVSSGFTKEKRLCLSCATDIVNKTQSDLDAIKHQL